MSKSMTSKLLAGTVLAAVLLVWCQSASAGLLLDIYLVDGGSEVKAKTFDATVVTTQLTFKAYLQVTGSNGTWDDDGVQSMYASFTAAGDGVIGDMDGQAHGADFTATTADGTLQDLNGNGYDDIGVTSGFTGWFYGRNGKMYENTGDGTPVYHYATFTMTVDEFNAGSTTEVGGFYRTDFFGAIWMKDGVALNGSAAGISVSGVTLTAASGVTALSNTDADDSGSTTAWGTPVTANVGDGGNYADAGGSQVNDYTGGPGGVPINPPSGPGSTVTLLGGSDASGSDDGAVTVKWRTRTPAEEALDLISDVVSVTDMANASEHGQTDIFVLQMDYDASLLDDETSEAAAGEIHLVWLDESDGNWKNAIEGNYGANVGATNVLGEWDDEGGSTLALGAWGVDTANDVVWAVLNHNSQFAVVPEPATVAFLAFGGIAMVGAGLARRRNRKAKA